MGIFGIGKKKWEAQVRAAEEAAAAEAEERSLSEKVMEQQQWEESLRKFVRTESQRSQGQRVVEENARHTAASEDFFEEHDQDSTDSANLVHPGAEEQELEATTSESSTQTQEPEDDYDTDDAPAQDPYDDEGYDASAEYEDDYDDEDEDYDDEDEDEETRQARVKDYMTRLGLTNDENDPEQKIELVTDETVLLHLPDTPEEDAHTTVTEPETYAGALPVISAQDTGASVQETTDTGQVAEADDSENDPEDIERYVPAGQESVAGTGAAAHQSPSIADEVAFNASDSPAEAPEGAVDNHRSARPENEVERFEEVPMIEFAPIQNSLKKPSENPVASVEEESREMHHDDAEPHEEDTRTPEDSAAEAAGADPLSSTPTHEPAAVAATTGASAAVADSAGLSGTSDDTHHAPEPIFDAPDAEVLTPDNPLYTLIETMREHGHGQLTFDLHQVNDDMNYRLYYQGDEIEKGVVVPGTIWFDSVAALYVAAQDSGTVWTRALVAASPSLGGRVAVQASYMSAADSTNWDKNYIFPATEQDSDAADTIAEAAPATAFAEGTEPGAAPESTHDYDADPLMRTNAESERDEAPGEKTQDDFETADEAEPTHDAVSDETADAAPLAGLDETQAPEEQETALRENTQDEPLPLGGYPLNLVKADEGSDEPDEAEELLSEASERDEMPQPAVEDAVLSTEEPADSFTEDLSGEDVSRQDTQQDSAELDDTELDNAKLDGVEEDSIAATTDTDTSGDRNQPGQVGHASLTAQSLAPHTDTTAEAENTSEAADSGAEEEDIDGMAAALAAIVASAESKLQKPQAQAPLAEDSAEDSATAPTVHETVAALNEGAAAPDLGEDEPVQVPDDGAAVNDDTGPLPAVSSDASWQQDELEDTTAGEKDKENTAAGSSKIVNVTSAVAANDASAEAAAGFLRPADAHTTNLVDAAAFTRAADTGDAGTEADHTVDPEAQAPMTGAADLDTVTAAASEGTAHRGPELPEHVDDEELVPAVEKESLLAPVQQTAAETETEQKPESTCSDPDTPTVCADPDTPTVQPAADVSVLSDTKLAEGNLTLTEAQVAHRLAPVVEALFGEGGTATDATTVLIRVRALGSYYDALTHVRRNGFWEQVRTFDLVPEETLDIPRLKTDSYSEGEGSPLAISLTFTPGVPVQAAFDYSSEQAFVRYPRQLEAERYVEELRMFPRLGARIPAHMAAALAHWNL